MFPKLRLKYKPNLISLAGGLADLPITKPGECGRGTSTNLNLLLALFLET